MLLSHISRSITIIILPALSCMPHYKSFEFIVNLVFLLFSRGKASHKKTSFRAAYGELSTLRSFSKPGTPVLALTATVERKSRANLIKLLGMHAPTIVDVSINNENIRFSVQKIKKGLQCFNWLVDKIAAQQQSTPKTIIFCRSITDVSTVLSYLLTKLGSAAYVDQEKSPLKCLIAVYHSNSPAESKERVKKSLKLNDGPIRIVLATSALSLGVNFKDVRYIIHYGPAPDLRNQLQEAGRAGRDRKAAFNVIYYHGQQLHLCDNNLKESLKVTSCFRVAFLKNFDSTVKPLEEGHNCCCNCHHACQCAGENCAVNLPVFESAGSQETLTSRERGIDDTDVTDFESALKELQENLDRTVAFPVLGNKLMAHGFSDSVIKEIVSDVQHIFTAEYLIENHHIVSLPLARVIMEIIQEQFEVIDISQDPLFGICLTDQLEGTTGASTIVENPSIADDTLQLFENYFDSSSGSSDELTVSVDELDDYFSLFQL